MKEGFHFIYWSNWEKPGSAILILVRWNIYWPISWIQLSSRGKGVTEILFYISSSCLTLRKQKCCKIKHLTSQDQPDLCSLLPKEPAHNEIRYLSFERILEFHFYLSIMHEVAEIRPRSAMPPSRGAPINTSTLVCLSHPHQLCISSLRWLPCEAEWLCR